MCKYQDIIFPLFLTIFALQFLFGITDTYCVLMLLFGVFLFKTQIQAVKKFVLLDWAVTVFSVVNFVACFSNVITVYSLSESAFFALCLGLYYTIKHRETKNVDIFLTIFFSVAAIAMLLSIVSFLVFRKNTLTVGFTDCYNFRFLYRPLGFTCNFWAECSIIVTGLLMFWKHKFRNLLLFVAILSVMLTFSRGAYIALIVLCVGSFFVDKNKKFFIVPFMVAMFIILIFCNKELFKTLSFNTQTIQKQSTEWRVNSIKDDFKVFLEKPIIGHGTNSYGIVTGKNHDLDSRKNFSGVAPNIFVKIAVEQGVIGIVALLFLMITVLLVALKFWNKTNVKISILMFMTIFICELSQSSFPENRFTIFVCYILIGVVYKSCYNVENSAYDFPLMRYCAYAMYVAVFGIIISKFTHIIDNKKNYQLFSDIVKADFSLLKGNVDESENILQSLYKKYPNNSEINYYLGKTYCKRGDTTTAISYLKKSVLLAPKILDSKDFISMSKNDTILYNKLINNILKTNVICNSPQDYARIGFILNRYGDKQRSKIMLKNAVEKMPSLSTPWLLLGDTAKYNLLTNGAFQGENHKIIISEKEFSVYDMFYQTYIK